MEINPNSAFPVSDPRHYTQRVKKMLGDLIEHLREDTDKFDEPKAQALFETSAEVLQGLRTAFDHYESGKERALREK